MRSQQFDRIFCRQLLFLVSRNQFFVQSCCRRHIYWMIESTFEKLSSAVAVFDYGRKSSAFRPETTSRITHRLRRFRKMAACDRARCHEDDASFDWHYMGVFRKQYNLKVSVVNSAWSIVKDSSALWFITSPLREQWCLVWYQRSK